MGDVGSLLLLFWYCLIVLDDVDLCFSICVLCLWLCGLSLLQWAVLGLLFWLSNGSDVLGCWFAFVLFLGCVLFPLLNRSWAELVCFGLAS